MTWLLALSPALASTTSLTPPPAWSWTVYTEEITEIEVSVGGMVVADFDADGYDDLAFSGQGEDGVPDVGIAVFFGGPGGLPAEPDLRWDVPLDPRLVLVAADVTGDGYDDLVVGMPGPTVPDGPGRLVVYEGSSARTLTEIFSEPGATFSEEQLGQQVVAATDLDQDGFEDVLVAKGESYNPTWVWYRGAPDGLVASGWSVTGDYVIGGDFDGDGYGEVARADLNDYYVHLYPGSAQGPGDTASWSQQIPANDLGATDANGDGVLDLGIYIAPVPYMVQTDLQWFSFAAGDPGDVPAVAAPVPSYAYVDGLGDLDGDGIGDWGINTERFRTVAVLGSVPWQEAFVVEAVSSEYTEGYSSSRIARGEFDGDGCPDLAVNAAPSWRWYEGYYGSEYDLEPALGVWYCPIAPAEPPPTETGDTASDTGLAPDTDTDTDTGTPPAGEPAADEPSKGCGCATSSTNPYWPLLLGALLYRRRQPPTSRPD